MKIAGTIEAGQGHGFPGVGQFLNFLRNQWEEVLPRTAGSQESDTTQELDLASEADGVVLALVSAWNRHDMKAWADCFAPDADYINVSGIRWRGRAEIEAQLDELHRTVLRHSRFRPMEWTIRTITPGVSLVHLNWQMKGTGPTRRGILTLVLTLVRDRWVVESAHNTDVVH